MSPQVSVIMTVYNYGRYLREAIDSALRQSYPACEIILVNDGSTDDTEKIALSYGPKICYHFQKHQGLAAPKNQGVEMAHGDFITFLDADDIWPEERLKALMRPILENSSIEMVFGRLQNFLSPKLSAEKEKELNHPAEVMNGICPGTMLVKKTSFLKVGLFKPQWKVTEFLDWYLHAKELNICTAWVEDLVLHRRLHENNNTFIHREHLAREFAQVLRASLARRRTCSNIKKSYEDLGRG